MSDNHVANSSEPWIAARRRQASRTSRSLCHGSLNGRSADGAGHFLPYLRDLETFARPWAIPGTPGLEHRIGGIEKEAVTGNVSYDPGNHQLMTDSRAWKIANIANDIPESKSTPTRAPRSWCSVGDRPSAPSRPPPTGSAAKGKKPIAIAHLRYLNPFPKNLGEVVRCLSDSV